MTQQAPPQLPMGRALVGLLVLALITGGMSVFLDRLGGLARVQQVVAEAGAWAPILFILAKVATYVLAPLSGAPLKISAGVLFGFWNGTIYTLLGDVIGASLNYWIGRGLGRRFVELLVGAHGMQRVNEWGTQIGGWRALLFARIVLSAAYDFVSYAAGLIALPFTHFLAVTFFGGIIPVLFWVALGASWGIEGSAAFWIYSAAAVIFLLIVVLQRHIWRLLHIGARQAPNPQPERKGTSATSENDSAAPGR